MTATWTAPMTWTAAHTVTAAELNTYLRDELEYLKGILDGTSLQNVLISDARAFNYGTGRRVARFYANSLYTIDTGSYTVALNNSADERTVSFSAAFTAAPGLWLSFSHNHADALSWDHQTRAVTATNFLQRIETTEASAVTFTVCWMAIGVLA